MFKVLITTLLVAGATHASAAQPWRTPQVNFATSDDIGIVSCSLLNNAGRAVTVTNLRMRVVGQGGQPISVGDGLTFSLEDGTSFNGVAALQFPPHFNPVYCEIDGDSDFSTKDQNLSFTMTAIDKHGKVHVIAQPRRR